MADRNRAFRTGERVAEAGNYVSEAGEKAAYREGDEFRACPATGRETNWRREEEECGC
ncbi:hypothetical protein C8P63_114105 [Melghirimyces profundicolus]|uniref:Uncharacterized protein n=1 Tax=Melghirimyces profundicolus TaxID=1242148 RepID=A0A2T6BS57_9BACL|nr:hypothetical protein [Melghirimyces profundicolus]PTX58923.1 hypothetical protein C8P63_114105 [Melghirimyces profundicolus]